MKHVELKTSAWINGVLRHPHEGAIPLTNAEADRLIKMEVADDVTADFADADTGKATATVTADAAVADATKKGDAK